jgi:hypothetical protein
MKSARAPRRSRTRIRMLAYTSLTLTICTGTPYQPRGLRGETAPQKCHRPIQAHHDCGTGSAIVLTARSAQWMWIATLRYSALPFSAGGARVASVWRKDQGAMARPARHPAALALAETVAPRMPPRMHARPSIANMLMNFEHSNGSCDPARNAALEQPAQVGFVPRPRACANTLKRVHGYPACFSRRRQASRRFNLRERSNHAAGALRPTSCTTQLLPSGSLKERNEP